MIDATSSFELEEFERVEAAPKTALLRIAARTTIPPAGRPLHLVVDDGSERHRLPPLPGPTKASGLLRIAFSAPSALLATARFAIELPDGELVPLPAPGHTRRIGRRASDGPGSRGPGREQDRLQARLREAEVARTELLTQLDERSAAADAQRADLEALRGMSAEMAGRLEEAEARVDALAEVVRRLTADRDAVAEELAQAKTAREQADGTIVALAAQLDQLAARAQASEQVASAAGTRADGQVEALGAELARADGERRQLQQALTEAISLRAEMVAARDGADVHTELLRRELDQFRSQHERSGKRAKREVTARRKAEAKLSAVRDENAELSRRAEQLAARANEEQARAAKLSEVVQREAAATAARNLAEQTAELLARDLRAATERIRESDLELERLRLSGPDEVPAEPLSRLELAAAERARAQALAEIVAAGGASELIVASLP